MAKKNIDKIYVSDSGSTKKNLSSAVASVPSLKSSGNKNTALKSTAKTASTKGSGSLSQKVSSASASLKSSGKNTAAQSIAKGYGKRGGGTRTSTGATSAIRKKIY